MLASSGRRARSCLVDRKDALARHATAAADAVLAASDAQAASLAARAAAAGGGARYGLVWAQLRELDDFYWGRCKHARRAHQLALARAAADEARAAAPGAAEGGSGRGGGGSGGRGGAAAAKAPPPPAPGAAGGGAGHPGAGALDPEDEAALARAAAELEADAPKWSDEALKQQLMRLDAALGALTSGLPRNALLIVATGQGDTPEARRQQELKIRRQQGLDGLPPWSTADDEAYSAMLEREMMGLCFCMVKR